MLDRARVREVFGDAAPLPEAERGEFLDRACGGDAALRAEVESLLIAAARRPGFMAAPTAGGGDDAGLEAAGTRIGPYTLEAPIGHGGFGTVYLAEQAEPVRRRVALKIIKAGMDTREVIARFEAERRALAMMDHPHIARVLDVGATPAGRPYFVMELVKGRPITAYADEAGLSVAERLDLFVQVCRAVQHAHAKGVIHRDIKPGNVLVAESDGRPQAKVIDFGIAKAIDPPEAARTRFTLDRQWVGTPEYMSPEQTGGAPDVDTRTDVYSLGVLLYELLTGATPFDPGSLRGAAYDEIQRIIREVDPPRPSTRLSGLESLASVAARRRTQPERLSAALRGDLDWIVMRALEKDRSRRYDAPSALAAEVQRHLDGQPVEAAPPSAVYRARKFVRRNRAAVAAGGAVLAAILAGGGAALRFALAEAMQREAAEAALGRAVTAEEQARERAAQLETVAAFQAAQLARVDPFSMGARLREAVAQRASAAWERAGYADEERDARGADLRRLLAGSDFTGLARDALEGAVFRPALAAAAEGFEAQPLVKAGLLQATAEAMRSLGLLSGAVEPQDEAVSIRRRMLGDAHEDTLRSLNSAGLLRLQMGRLAQAESRLREAMERSERVLGPDHAVTLLATENLGATLERRGRLAEAEPLYRRVMETRRRVLGDAHLDTLYSLNEMGMLLYSQGRFKESEGFLREALAGRRSRRGDRHADTALSVANLGLVLQAQGRWAEAEPLLREGLELNRLLLGDEHPTTQVSINNLGLLLHTMGRRRDAEPYYREALALNRRTLGDRHISTLVSASNLGFLLMQERRFEEAEAHLREAMNGLRIVAGAEHLNTLFATIGLAGTLTNMERPRDAVDLLAPAEGAARRVFVNDHAVRLGQFLSTLGSARVGAGEFDAAERSLLEAYDLLRRAGDPGLAGTVGSLCRLYEARHRAEPGAGYDRKRDEWQKRSDEPASPSPRAGP